MEIKKNLYKYKYDILITISIILISNNYGTQFFYKKLRSSLSTECFLIFLLFSVVTKSIVYWISIVICQKVEFKFLIKQCLAKNVCFQCSMNFMGVSK